MKNRKLQDEVVFTRDGLEHRGEIRQWLHGEVVRHAVGLCVETAYKTIFIPFENISRYEQRYAADFSEDDE